MKRIFLWVILLGVAGCATKPITNDQAKEVPVQRLFDASLATQRDDSGQVVIKRDDGLRGSVCTVRVFADGKPAADLKPAEKVTLYLDAGDHVFSAQGTGACYGGLSAQSGKVTKDKSMTYRVGLGSVGDFAIYPDSL